MGWDVDLSNPRSRRQNYETLAVAERIGNIWNNDLMNIKQNQEATEK